MNAQINLGILYATTEALSAYERDYAEAHKWLLIAAKLGSEDAVRIDKKLQPFITTKEMAEGEKRMQAWFENHTCTQQRN